jgi:hypothetical protein
MGVDDSDRAILERLRLSSEGQKRKELTNMITGRRYGLVNEIDTRRHRTGG